MELSLDVISFVAGALLVAVAAIGGGISIKEVRLPRIDTGARAVLFLVGASMLGLSLWLRTYKAEDTFANPMYDGFRLDTCMVFAGDCQGGHSAMRWCRKEKHYTLAVDYEVDTNVGARGIKTKTIGNDDVCDKDYCSAYRSITCRK
jgi:hypothetical protein